MGGGKSSGQQGQNALPFVKLFEGETRPLRSELFGQITEALRTGGVGAHIPIIQSAVASSRAATSSALRGTSDSLARTGLSRTPFATRELTGTRLTGEQATTGIPTSLAQALMQFAPGGLQFAGNVLGALGSQGQSSGKQGHFL